MARYRVEIIYTYEVEADCQYNAEDEAIEEFECDRRNDTFGYPEIYVTSLAD